MGRLRTLLKISILNLVDTLFFAGMSDRDAIYRNIFFNTMLTIIKTHTMARACNLSPEFISSPTLSFNNSMGENFPGLPTITEEPSLTPNNTCKKGANIASDTIPKTIESKVKMMYAAMASL
jgi:hypothetical protein